MPVRSMIMVTAAAVLLATGLSGCTSTGGAGTAAGAGGGEGDVIGGAGGGEMAGGSARSGTGLGLEDGPMGEAMDGSGSGGAAAGAGETMAPPAQTTIYFAYDRSDVPEEYLELVAAHASFIREAGVIDVRVEGHADERGSREYNIGLGERRAQAVRQLLVLNGVPAARLSTVSYGEERPVAFGHDEQSWTLNRRVEIVYGR